MVTVDLMVWLLLILLSSATTTSNVTTRSGTATNQSGTVAKYRPISSYHIEYYLADTQAYDHINDKLLRATGFINSRENCGGASGEVRVSTWAGLSDTCWYAADWRILLHTIHSKNNTTFSPSILNDLYIHICDGDCNSIPLPGSLVVAKSRRIIKDPQLRTCTLVPLNVERHFKQISEALGDSIPFEQKKPIAIWRGTTTGLGWSRLVNKTSNNITAAVGGYGFDVDVKTLEQWSEYDNDRRTQGAARWNLVARWTKSSSPMVDVGLNMFAQMNDVEQKWYEPYLKDTMNISSFFEYRYIISVEGNDVSTNLKWAMASGSVVLMPKPRVETFFGEGLLRPYVHYLPIADDAHDLESKIKYCERRKNMCRAIAEAGRLYAQQFSSIPTLYEWGAEVLSRHVQMIMQHLAENRTKESLGIV